MVRFEYDSGVLLFSCRGGKRTFLILKRKSDTDIPKGHIEDGENALDAAIRETREETGITAKPDLFFRHILEYWFHNGKDKVKKRAVIFIARVPEGSRIKVSNEHIGYSWMTASACMKNLKFENQKELISHADDYLNRMKLMEKLNSKYAKLSRSRGFALSSNLVKGEGPMDAEIMIIGQAPGANEDESGRPFIGRAGKMLDSMLRKARIDRKGVYITSVVQFFPPANRIPSGREIGMCMPLLKEQINIIKPKLVVALGRVASKALCGVENMSENHGRVVPLVILPKQNVKCFITMHPAAGVRFKKNIAILEDDFRKLGRIIKEDAI